MEVRKGVVVNSKEEEPYSCSALPSWVHFDKPIGVVTLEPKLIAHMGTYEFYITISIEISIDSFKKVINTSTSQIDLHDLMDDLVPRGYGP